MTIASDTWIHTKEGPRQVLDLVGHKTSLLYNTDLYNTTPEGFFKSGTRQLFKLTTKEGYTLRVVDDQELIKVTENDDWTHLVDLVPGDKIRLQNHRDTATWKGEGTLGDGYLIGLLINNGILDLSEEDANQWHSVTGVTNNVYETHNDFLMEQVIRYSFISWIDSNDKDQFRLSMRFIKEAAASYNLSKESRCVDPTIEKKSSDFHRGFLRAVFDCSSTICQDAANPNEQDIRLTQTNPQIVEAIQRMLLRLGIVSYVIKKGGVIFGLSINDENVRKFYSVVGYNNINKTDSINAIILKPNICTTKETFEVTIDTILPDSVEDVYEVIVSEISAFDANGFTAHNRTIRV